MKRLTFYISFAALTLTAASAGAEQHAGTITRYHLNADLPDRGACVTMSPGLVSGWACVWKSNPLYKEISAVLLTGFASGTQCHVYWRTGDPQGNALIYAADCQR